jgi:hypothetical protein
MKEIRKNETQVALKFGGWGSFDWHLPVIAKRKKMRQE